MLLAPLMDHPLRARHQGLTPELGTWTPESARKQPSPTPTLLVCVGGTPTLAPSGLSTCVHPRDSPGSGLLGGQGGRERCSARDEKQPHVMGARGRSGQSWPGLPLGLKSQPPARNLPNLSARGSLGLGVLCVPLQVLGEGRLYPGRIRLGPLA